MQKGEETTTKRTSTTTASSNNNNKCRDEEEEDEEEGDEEGEDTDMGDIMNILHRVSQGLHIMKIIMKAHRVRMRQRVVEDMMMSIMKVQNVRKSHSHARPIGRLRPGRGTDILVSGGCFRFYGRGGAIINLCPMDEESTAATRKCMRMTNKLRLSRSQSSAFVCVCWHLGTNKGREIPMHCETEGEGGKGRRTTDDGVGTCDEDTLKHEAGCGKFEFESRLTAC